jgi:YGGT family
MADSYDREVVRQETTTGEPAPVRPVAPLTSTRSSSTSVYRRSAGPYRAIQAVWWIVGFIDTLIAIRFVLRLFGANPAPFVRFMYDLTWPLVAPFHGIFNTSQVGRSVFEAESLVAIAIYTLIGWGIVSLIRLLSGPSSTTTVVD